MNLVFIVLSIAAILFVAFLVIYSTEKARGNKFLASLDKKLASLNFKKTDEDPNTGVDYRHSAGVRINLKGTRYRVWKPDGELAASGTLKENAIVQAARAALKAAGRESAPEPARKPLGLNESGDTQVLEGYQVRKTETGRWRIENLDGTPHEAFDRTFATLGAAKRAAKTAA